MTEYGIQMYSIRDVAKKDLKEALRTVASLGYRYVEFAGFYDHPAEEVRAWLDEFGLICSGTHTPMMAVRPDTIAETIRYHQALGCKKLILPGGNWGSEEEFNDSVKLIRTVQKELAANGIALGYHNHSGEFMETPYGKFIEKAIIEETEAELEVDTFWAFNAGLDPVAFLEENKKRIRVIHIKDGIPSAPENKNFAQIHQGVKGVALGEGQAPVKAVREWALANGVTMVVESEGLDPTGPEEIGRCIKYLRTLD